MKEHIIFTLRGIWLGAASVSLILPVILPSYPGYVFSPIITSTVTLFLISFPSSLLLLPYLAVMEIFFGPAAFTIGALFQNLLILFALGALQWMWLLPKIFKTRDQEAQLSMTPDMYPEPGVLHEGDALSSMPSREKSPVQVLVDDQDDPA